MAHITRKIGLSLGADICWPICYEALLQELDLQLTIGGDTVRFESNRVGIEPFDLRGPCQYDVVIDRLTHWYHTSREWIKKAILVNDLYVFNNPWSLQSMEKHTSYCAMMRLGLPVPDTWMVPPKEYAETADLEPTLRRYAEMFDLGEIGERLQQRIVLRRRTDRRTQAVAQQGMRAIEILDQHALLPKSVKDRGRLAGRGPQQNEVGIAGICLNAGHRRKGLHEIASH